jgi:hypothetical protein
MPFLETKTVILDDRPAHMRGATSPRRTSRRLSNE